MKAERGNINVVTIDDSRGNRVASTTITTGKGERFSLTTQAFPTIFDDGKKHYSTLVLSYPRQVRGEVKIALFDEDDVTNKEIARENHLDEVYNLVYFLKYGKQ